LAGLPSEAHRCFISSIVLGKGKGIGYCFGRSDKVEIRRLMVAEENDIVIKRRRESVDVIR